MKTDYCELCKDEDTNRCMACDGYGNDLLEEKLAKILDTEHERIKGEDG